ncbi:ATP-dependent DNA helicase [Mesorhizobium sp. LSJC285A00]|nr:ATP-dependent DNA helicase [Mesorhizobium sp. LSJC285A00]
MKLSEQQTDVVELPLEPIAITACAGSGKTRTAVHRLAEMRRRLDDRHGMVALLSFSNIAVDTFRRDYLALMRANDGGQQPFGIEIDTVDGFITTNVLRPHGYHVMGCGCTPYLVDGREPFLKNFTVFDGVRPNPTADLRISFENGDFSFKIGRNAPKKIPTAEAKKALGKLGAVGAYTHASARYWVLRVLKEKPYVLRALVRRYPHILVDEAQDVGPEHEAILKLMVDGGSRLSLIGDPHQGIYEFSGANGSFLSGYAKQLGVTERNLSINYRSVPAIVDLANKLCGRNDKAKRIAPEILNGAFFIPFKKDEKDNALATFRYMLKEAGIADKDGVVVCRSGEWADQWSGGEDGQGQGIVKAFADAAVCRDKFRRLDQAYDHTCIGIVGLLANQHRDLISKLSRPAGSADIMKLRRAIWGYARDPAAGLPSATLLADTQWHPLLVERAKSFIAFLESDFGLSAGENLGNRLAKKALLNKPLIQMPDLAQPDSPPQFRVSTVHKVKGESLEGVMYVVSKEHAEGLLNGTGTEVGRIGYVALTRARNLFVLAVPSNALGALEPRLVKMGFMKPGKAA